MSSRLRQWLEYIHGGAESTWDEIVKRWRAIPFWIKIAAWIPFQGVLFVVQREIFLFEQWLLSQAGLLIGEVTELSIQTLLLLLVIAFMGIQTIALVLKLNSIEAELSNVSSPQASAQNTISDGGSRAEPKPSEEEPGTSGVGAIGGAIAGGAIGSSFGPAGAVGGAVLGLIVGDEIEKDSKSGQS